MNNKPSLKTTVFGIVCIIAAVANFAKAFLDGDPNTVPNLNDVIQSIGLLGAGAVGVAAADHANLPGK